MLTAERYREGTFCSRGKIKIAVAIATTGRPKILADAIGELVRQSRWPDRTIVSASVAEDVDESALRQSPLEVEVLFGRKGSSIQRNAVLDALRDEDAVLFVDDDFVMAPDFLERLVWVFTEHSGVGVVTGNVVADGVCNAGLSLCAARKLLTRSQHADDRLADVDSAYGCNMAFRCAPIRAHGLRFDDGLPLYGWLEDLDFSRRAAEHGRCVKAMGLHGVHLGTKAGRTSGVRLGYSQVANPIHLVGRMTMGRGEALWTICRNLAANAAKSFRPEPWVDRTGRLRGNVLALTDLVRGRLDPERVLKLDVGTDAPSR